jgi:hypothetical protein
MDEVVQLVNDCVHMHGLWNYDLENEIGSKAEDIWLMWGGSMKHHRIACSTNSNQDLPAKCQAMSTDATIQFLRLRKVLPNGFP